MEEIFTKILSRSDLSRLAIPMGAYRQYLERSFEGNGMVLNVVDHFGMSWELQCIRRGEEDSNPRPEIAGLNWVRFVSYWDLKAGESVTLYKQPEDFRGIRYRIIAVRTAGF